MSIIAIIIVLCVVGLIVWAFAAYVPLPQPFKSIVIFLIILLTCLWILSGLGVIGSLRA